jgi:hypothetical protein
MTVAAVCVDLLLNWRGFAEDSEIQLFFSRQEPKLDRMGERTSISMSRIFGLHSNRSEDKNLLRFAQTESQFS